MMKNKKLKELLEQLPDDSNVHLLIGSAAADIGAVSIEYFESDEYTIPDIVIEGNY